MDAPDALTIAAMIADESRDIVKLLAIGVRTNGSVFIVHDGLSDEDFETMFKDFRVWLGGRLGKELMGQS